jgi:hypothetical protein
MATQAKMTIRVTSSRGASNITVSTSGRYISLPVNTVSADLPREPVFTTASAKAFWEAVLPIVSAAVTADP